MTFLRMYILQAGTMKTMMNAVATSFPVSPFPPDSLEFASTAKWKHCSQEKPTRILMAPMMFWTTFFSAVASPAALSSILSRTKMTRKEIMQRTRARTILPTMVKGPMSQISSMCSLCETPRAPKRTHQAKALPRTLLKTPRNESSFSAPGSSTTRVATIAMPTAAPRRMRSWSTDCISDSGTAPSLFGRTPRITNLMMETSRKDACRPWISASLSDIVSRNSLERLPCS
mmetsp:Transcript_2192/g.6441  ORF Transcript_2192/g.6441 Transcript_2192/m.6441 type:complete len:230 (+) Transcript_2192:218-907(+)